MPSSAARFATTRELRPVISASSMPAPASSFSPSPSRVWKLFISSPPSVR